jgi:hypothetical protein
MLGSKFVKQRGGTSDSSVINQDVGTSEGVLNTTRELLDSRERGQVANVGATIATTLTNLLGGFFERLRGAADDDRSGSQSRKPAGDGGADPASATGDDSDLSMEYVLRVCHRRMIISFGKHRYLGSQRVFGFEMIEMGAPRRGLIKNGTGPGKRDVNQGPV